MRARSGGPIARRVRGHSSRALTPHPRALTPHPIGVPPVHANKVSSRAGLLSHPHRLRSVRQRAPAAPERRPVGSTTLPPRGLESSVALGTGNTTGRADARMPPAGTCTGLSATTRGCLLVPGRGKPSAPPPVSLRVGPQTTHRARARGRQMAQRPPRNVAFAWPPMAIHKIQPDHPRWRIERRPPETNCPVNVHHDKITAQRSASQTAAAGNAPVMPQQESTTGTH